MAPGLSGAGCGGRRLCGTRRGRWFFCGLDNLCYEFAVSFWLGLLWGARQQNMGRAAGVAR